MPLMTTLSKTSRSLLEIQTTSQDNNYEKLPIDAVTIEIVDNDLPTASIIPVSDSSEEAEPGRFRIELSEPAPSSAGSNGVLVQYSITDLQLDSEGCTTHPIPAQSTKSRNFLVPQLGKYASHQARHQATSLSCPLMILSKTASINPSRSA